MYLDNQPGYRGTIFNTTAMRFLSFLLSLLFISCSGMSYAQNGYADEIRGYADSLYRSLEPLQRKAGALSFDDTARLKWNNLPVGLRARAGINIGRMNEAQRKLVHRILSAALSSQGYLKATGIMHLDDLLNRYYDSLYYGQKIPESTYKMIRSLQWSHENYYFAFFGSPGQMPWGIKLEGHHLSVNFTFTADRIAVTPLFVGTDPAEYPNSVYAGWRVLGQEEDLGLKFIRMLTPAQRKQATKDTVVPGDIITAAESGRRLVDYWGIKGKDLGRDQKAVLEYMIREFVFNLEYDKAVAEFGKIRKAGFDNVYFGWIGAYTEEIPHYYIINGPGFLIEFDNRAGGPRNAANHIHAIWREKGNDFGEDILKAHYQQVKH